MTDQLTLEFKATATDAVRDVAAKCGPLRSLEILIALWHDYTWQQVESAIKSLVRRGEIEISGMYRSQPNPTVAIGISDEIYRIKEARE